MPLTTCQCHWQEPGNKHPPNSPDAPLTGKLDARRIEILFSMSLLRFLPTFTILFWFWSATAVVNRTIDDTFGDAATGSRPLYLPSTPGVWEGATCKGCAIMPDPNHATNRTWTAATYNPNLGSMSIELTFKGTAIYVFFILANFVADGITTETACNFTLNGREPVPFSHIPSLSHELEYNSLAFSEENLVNDDHKLVISTSGISDRNIFVNFDYAVYTFDDTPTLSSTFPSSTRTLNTNINSQETSHHAEDTHGTSHSKINVGLVAGCAVGGFVALAAIALLFLCLRYRKRPLRRRGAISDFVIDEELPRMAPATTHMHTPFPIDLVSTEERFRERPLTHSDFLQSGTILSPATARPLSYVTPDHDDTDKPSWMNALPISRTRSITIDTSRLSTISSPPSGDNTADTSIDSHPSIPLRHARSSSAATSDLWREALQRTRQSEIDQQLRAARRELRDLKIGLRMESVRRPPNSLNPSSQADEGEIGEMREQMRQMQEQIEKLQRQQQSGRAPRRSDEDPPGYSSPAQPYLTRLE